jgi:hypothetical protein
MVGELSRRLAECFAANDPKIPSVRIPERRESAHCFGKTFLRRQQNIDVDYRFRREAGNGRAAHMLDRRSQIAKRTGNRCSQRLK